MNGTPEPGPGCTHPRQEMRKRTLSSGNVTPVMQCLACGAHVCTVAKRVLVRDGISVSRLPEHDPAIARRYSEERSARWQAAYQARREQESEEWWARYHAYLASPEWAKVRWKVLRRANGICEGCGERPPVQAHHLTYKRLGHEMLFDLVAVCLQCHEQIHGHPIGEER